MFGGRGSTFLTGVYLFKLGGGLVVDWARKGVGLVCVVDYSILG